MSDAPARRSRWPLAAVIAPAIAMAGTLLVAVQHARIGHSAAVTALIAASFAAAVVGAIAGLLAADRRRNVLWILALAVSMTAMMALLAIVVASLAPD